jgi:hypothetical protein
MDSMKELMTSIEANLFDIRQSKEKEATPSLVAGSRNPNPVMQDIYFKGRPLSQDITSNKRRRKIRSNFMLNNHIDQATTKSVENPPVIIAKSEPY